MPPREVIEAGRCPARWRATGVPRRPGPGFWRGRESSSRSEC